MKTRPQPLDRSTRTDVRQARNDFDAWRREPVSRLVLLQSEHLVASRQRALAIPIFSSFDALVDVLSEEPSES